MAAESVRGLRLRAASNRVLDLEEAWKVALRDDRTRAVRVRDTDDTIIAMRLFFAEVVLLATRPLGTHELTILVAANSGDLGFELRIDMIQVVDDEDTGCAESYATAAIINGAPDVIGSVLDALYDALDIEDRMREVDGHACDDGIFVEATYALSTEALRYIITRPDFVRPHPTDENAIFGVAFDMIGIALFGRGEFAERANEFARVLATAFPNAASEWLFGRTTPAQLRNLLACDAARPMVNVMRNYYLTGDAARAERSACPAYDMRGMHSLGCKNDAFATALLASASYDTHVALIDLTLADYAAAVGDAPGVLNEHFLLFIDTYAIMSHGEIAELERILDRGLVADLSVRGALASIEGVGGAPTAAVRSLLVAHRDGVREPQRAARETHEALVSYSWPDTDVKEADHEFPIVIASLCRDYVATPYRRPKRMRERADARYAP